MVLAAHSEYFHTVIDQAVKQNTQDVPVVYVDSDISMISNLLQYMYTGEISVSSSGIEDLCHQAEKYSMSRLVELCKNLKGTCTYVKQEVADEISDSSLKNEESVPVRWEYNSHEKPQNTRSLHHSELGAPVPDITQSGHTMQEVRVVVGTPVSNISHTGHTIQGVSRVFLGAPVSNISQSLHTVQGVRRMDLGAAVSNVPRSRDTVQEVRMVDLGIVKQEMTDSPSGDTGSVQSSMSTLSCNTVKSTAPPLSRSHVALPQDIELDSDRLENIDLKNEANSCDDQDMDFIEHIDLNSRPDSGTDNSGKRKQICYSPSVHKLIKTASGPIPLKPEDMSDTPIKWFL